MIPPALEEEVLLGTKHLANVKGHGYLEEILDAIDSEAPSDQICPKIDRLNTLSTRLKLGLVFAEKYQTVIGNFKSLLSKKFPEGTDTFKYLVEFVVHMFGRSNEVEVLKKMAVLGFLRSFVKDDKVVDNTLKREAYQMVETHQKSADLVGAAAIYVKKHTKVH